MEREDPTPSSPDWPQPDRIAPGQESVWDYPRPPRVENFPRTIKIVFADTVLAETQRAQRVLETSHPPVYYIPIADIRMAFLTEAEGGTVCEWKGPATYYTLRLDARTAERAAWRYGTPTGPFESISDCLAFYPRLMDVCYVNDEVVIPQPGEFYGGWITSDVMGPFKGAPETMGW